MSTVLCLDILRYSDPHSYLTRNSVFVLKFQILNVLCLFKKIEVAEQRFNNLIISDNADPGGLKPNRKRRKRRKKRRRKNMEIGSAIQKRTFAVTRENQFSMF
jgi:hypothetical protein